MPEARWSWLARKSGSGCDSSAEVHEGFYPGPEAIKPEDPDICTQTKLSGGELGRSRRDPGIMGVGTGKGSLGLESSSVNGQTIPPGIPL